MLYAITTLPYPLHTSHQQSTISCILLEVQSHPLIHITNLLYIYFQRRQVVGVVETDVMISDPVNLTSSAELLPATAYSK